MATLQGKTLFISGASRGIGHATVKKFSANGWRVITISRQPFSALCPWPGGDKNHVQIDLAQPNDVSRGIDDIRERLGGGRRGGPGLAQGLGQHGLQVVGPGGRRGGCGHGWRWVKCWSMAAAAACSAARRVGPLPVALSRHSVTSHTTSKVWRCASPRVCATR